MPPLYSLLLIGGKSTRMGSDKSLLDYYGQPQWLHNLSLFEGLVEKIFISVRKGQIIDFPNIIEDKQLGLGPFGAILSAMETFPDKAFLVFAVDIPFLNQTNLKKLVENRSIDYNAIAFKSKFKNYPEPLACIWEPKMLPILQNSFLKENYKLTNILKNTNVLTIEVDDYLIQNINTPEEYIESKKIIDLNKPKK